MVRGTSFGKDLVGYDPPQAAQHIDAEVLVAHLDPDDVTGMVARNGSPRLELGIGRMFLRDRFNDLTKSHVAFFGKGGEMVACVLGDPHCHHRHG